MKLRPLGDRIVVKALERAETTASGIILPDTVDKDQKAEGEIVAIGAGEKVMLLKLSIGQKVVYSQYGGSEIEIDSKEYKILSHDDVLAVIED